MASLIQILQRPQISRFLRWLGTVCTFAFIYSLFHRSGFASQQPPLIANYQVPQNTDEGHTESEQGIPSQTIELAPVPTANTNAVTFTLGPSNTGLDIGPSDFE